MSEKQQSSPLLPSERRRGRRHPASRLPKVHASILAGPDVEIVDVSPHGLLVESGVRLTPGAGICLTLKFDGESHMLGGRVARVDTTILDNKLRYRAGIALDGAFAPFDLAVPETKSEEPSEAPPQAAESAPVSGHDAPPQPAPPARAGVNHGGRDALRQALDEQRRNQEHGLRVIEMLKAALRASERARKEADEGRKREQDGWQQERQALEQAIELTARHKGKLSAELTAVAERERTLITRLEEERTETLNERTHLQGQLAAESSRIQELTRELEAQRERARAFERGLDEERAMLATLLHEKDRLVTELEELRATLAAQSKDYEQADTERRRQIVEHERLSQQLDTAERWCADQHELIYELWQQTQRSMSLIESWKSFQAQNGAPIANERRPAESPPANTPRDAGAQSSAEGARLTPAELAVYTAQKVSEA